METQLIGNDTWHLFGLERSSLVFWLSRSRLLCGMKKRVEGSMYLAALRYTSRTLSCELDEHTGSANATSRRQRQGRPLDRRGGYCVRTTVKQDLFRVRTDKSTHYDLHLLD
jgi:hypothetical protein